MQLKLVLTEIRAVKNQPSLKLHLAYLYHKFAEDIMSFFKLD